METPSSIGTKRALAHSESSEPPHARACFDRQVSSAGTDGNHRNYLVKMPEDVLEKIFSDLPIPELTACTQIDERVCKIIEDLQLPLAIWEQIPPSIRVFYTREQYELRYRDYLRASGGNHLITKFDDTEKPVNFAPRLFFHMRKHLITADEFDCSKKIIYSGYSCRFSCIFSEHSLCILVEKNPINPMVREIVEIDIHGRNKTSQISYDSKIIDTKICENSGRIATLLKNGYLELHKLEQGQWISTARIKYYVYEYCGGCALTDDYRSLIIRSDVNTLSIFKENNEGRWQEQTSIPFSSDYIERMIFSYDSNYLIIQDWKGTNIWKINDDGNYKQHYKMQRKTTDYFFSKDSKFLITSTHDTSEYSVILLALSGEKTCEKLFTPEPGSINPSFLYTVFPSPDNNSTAILLCPHYTNSCLIYGKNQVDDQYTYLSSVASKTHASSPLYFSPDGNFFSLETTDNMLEIWKKDNKGKWLKQMTTPHQSAIPISFNSNSTCLVTAPWPENWSGKKHFPINVLKLNSEGEWKVGNFFESSPVMEIKWLPDSNRFLTILEDESINQRTIMPIRDEIAMTDCEEDMQY